MMIVKLIIYSVIGIIVVIGMYVIGLSISSRQQPELGLINGMLRPCPVTPNCVCSEQQNEASFVMPFAYSTSTDEAWRRIKRAIVESGGVVITDENGYLHARYVTLLMRFVDDVELRLDDNSKVIHIQSASRVGRWDIGANRKRVEKIRSIYEKIGLESNFF